MKSFVVRAVLVLVSAAVAASCGDGGPAATSATADPSAGRTADGTPHRVVAFTCAAVDIFRVLGLLDRVVAVEEDCPAPGTEHAVKIRNDDHPGQVHIVQVESIMAMKPDLVIVKDDLREVFEGRGMRMLYSPPVLSMETLPGFVTDIATAMGVADRGAAVLDRMRRIEAEIAAVTAPLPKVRVYFENNGVGRTAGNGTITDAMITLAGGENVIRRAGVAADDRSPNVRLNPEAVIAADPEVILLGTFAPPMEEVISRPGWDRISAVRNGRVHRVPEERRYGTFGSPRCVEACRDMYVPWIHPEIATHEWKAGR